MGKLTTEDLKRLLDCIKKDPKVVVRPKLGFDAGVHRIGENKYIVVSTDPCIGVPEDWFGWLLINYVASDVALFGAKMEFCTINLLGSPATEAAVFQRIMEQACGAADELGITIVTGHTGTYDGISTVVGVCTGYGYVDNYRLITPAGAQPGDHIACVKPVGLETVMNFALIHRVLAEKLFGVRRTREITKLVALQSCVKEALLLADIKGVHAMHDATEGGLAAALNEIAEASDVGIKVYWENLLIPEEVQILREAYQLSDAQMLSMSSTGTFLAAVSPESRYKVEAVLRQNDVDVRFIGSFTKKSSRVLVKNGEETAFPLEADDPYARFLSTEW
jgi:hydrogenase expression/formation protein HypE